MRTGTTCAVYTSSAVDTPVIRSVITVIIVFSGDHRAIGSSTTCSVDAISTNHGMGLIADGETANQYHNRKHKASHRKLRLLPSRIRRPPSTVPNNVTVINTRDEHGGRLYPGWHKRGRVWVGHPCRHTSVKENKKGAFKPPSIEVSGHSKTGRDNPGHSDPDHNRGRRKTHTLHDHHRSGAHSCSR
jgi:hypothetical protein